MTKNWVFEALPKIYVLLFVEYKSANGCLTMFKNILSGKCPVFEL